MLLSRAANPMCLRCRTQLLNLFTNGLCSVAPSVQKSARSLPRRFPTRHGNSHSFHQARPRYATNHTDKAIDTSTLEAQAEKTLPQIEAIVRRARDTFGETLPDDFLSPEEYRVYERLYGPPIRKTSHEDAELLQDLNESGVEVDDAIPETTETAFSEEPADTEQVERPEQEEDSADIRNTSDEQSKIEEQSDEDFSARMMLYRDMVASMHQTSIRSEEPTKAEDMEEELIEDDIETTEEATQDDSRSHEYEEAEDAMDAFDEVSDSNYTRSHPLTQAGRFSTFPSTVQLPLETMVHPINRILVDTSNKQLCEVSVRTFGEGLPNSTATPTTKAHLQQSPIALEASQYKMGEIEANAYLATIMPGAYAVVMSILVETRKRLGSDWLEGLLRKPGGPRILDTGSAGAGVLAWREVLQAEWERMNTKITSDNPVPFGKATVVVGSSTLRNHVSSFLENTTFLPRLPDFEPTRDLPSSESHDPSLRKQYDIIVAPYTLWTLKEDYMRKAQVQNYFTLLNPNGGVLIVIEKGVPRGFELVAGAREVLLKHHISSPDLLEVENELQAPTTGRFAKKEEGMIIAPCTNHGTCPMYTVPGKMQGRKDHCHFSQRYERPQFLQRILGASFRNHEDIRFSYISIRRGVDGRRVKNVVQNEEATQAALVGFEKEGAEPNMLSLPRLLSPPLKRHKHVVFDFCTPAATLERWTLPKSFSAQAYRDGRKSKWGDLWALGAKNRVARKSRSGSLKNERKRRVIEVGVGANESEDTLRDITKYGKGEKRTKSKREKRDKKPKMLTEDDL